MLHFSLQHSLSTPITTGPCWQWRCNITVWGLTKPWPLRSNHENGWCWVPMCYRPRLISSTPYWYIILGWSDIWRKGEKRKTNEIRLIYTIPKYFYSKWGYFQAPPPFLRWYLKYSMHPTNRQYRERPTTTEQKIHICGEIYRTTEEKISTWKKI